MLQDMSLSRKGLCMNGDGGGSPDKALQLELSNDQMEGNFCNADGSLDCTVSHVIFLLIFFS